MFADPIAALRELDPPTPSVLHDRAADNKRALLVIADLAGGRWPDVAREVSTGLSNSGGSDDTSARVQLLADIQAIFEKTGDDKITSDALCVHLHEMDDRPWPEGKAEKPISKVQVARRAPQRMADEFLGEFKWRVGDDVVRPGGPGEQKIDPAFAISRSIKSVLITSYPAA